MPATAGPPAMGAYDSGPLAPPRQPTPTVMSPPQPSEQPAQPPWYQQPMGPMQPSEGMGADVAPSGSNMLGVSLLLIGAGAAVGGTYGGLIGAGAGMLIAGAAVNAVRAVKNVTQGTPEADREAAISGTFAVAGAGLAFYLLYRSRKDAATPNGEDDDEDDDEQEAAAAPAEAGTPV